MDQTRGWFYSLHALSTLLKGEPSYKNVICLGLILDERGRKMSKRVGNVVDPLPLLDEHGADALRWYLFTASQPGEARRFSSRLVNQTLRQVLLTLWNIYSFFTGYAAIDKFDPSQKPADWKPENELDRWVLSELNELVAEVDRSMENYDPYQCGSTHPGVRRPGCPTGTCAAADDASGAVTKATPTSCRAISRCTPAW